MSVVLRTDRLLLRPFEESDLPSVHRYASDPTVVNFVEWGPNTEEESAAFIRRAAARVREEPCLKYELAVVLISEDELIGGCGLRIRSESNGEAEVGYCLNRKYWGRGYATETALALLRFGFDELKLHRIYAVCDSENKASARVLSKIGMVQEGYLHELKLVRGHWRDHLLFAVLEQHHRNRY